MTFYITVISGLKAQGLFKSKLLTLDEIPEAVTILKKDIIVEKFDVISGVCTQQFATSGGLPSLCEALHIDSHSHACHALKDSLY